MFGPRAPSCVKLYNAGSFFDPRAVPECDAETLGPLLTWLLEHLREQHSVDRRPETSGHPVNPWAGAGDRRS